MTTETHMRQKIIDACIEAFPAHQEDCNKFVKAVANAIFTSPPFTAGSNADDIIAELKSNAAWTKLEKSHVNAIRDAKAGLFVIAGMTSADLGAKHGHVAVVVGKEGANSGTVLVPICYSGSLNETARVQGQPVSKTFGSANARQGKISYFSRKPA